MTIPPDDHPRSPTGRVPEWVKVEMRGGEVPDTAWRAAPPVPAKRHRRRRRRGLGAVVALLLVLGAGAAWLWASPETRGQVGALGSAQTWTGLWDGLRGVVDRVMGNEEGTPAAGASAREGDMAAQADASGPDMPPPGVGEVPTRLAPAVQPPNGSTAFTFSELQDDGVTPVTWSPCRVVSVVVNEAGAPAGFWDAVVTVAGELSDATGLVISVEGATTEAPTPQRAAFKPDEYGERWAPVLVGVTDEATVPELGGDVAGLSQTNRAGIVGGPWHIVSGSVFLDTDILDVPSPSDEPVWVAVLRHEMGHLVGLGHVADESQLMNERTTGVFTFQDGDLAGLALLGQGSCAPDL